MSDLNIGQTTQTDMKGGVPDFSVDAAQLDSEELVWDNRFFPFYLGYYKINPAFKKPIDALSIWTCGKGYSADNRTTSILESITGNGKQSFQVIMQSHQTMKKVNGDAYTQIIRSETGDLINFKLLNPERLRTIFNKEGIIIRYEQVDIKKENVIKTFKPEEILHSVNELIGDEIHGTSVLEASQWVLDARSEAMADWRRISHRSTIRVMYIDADDTTKIAHVKTEYKDAIKNGELMLIPAKKGEAEFEDMVLPPIDAFMQWIRYLENPGQEAVGIPKVIMGGAAEFTEAGSKVGLMTFDPTYSNEQLELEADLWNQVAIRVKFNRPPQITAAEQESEIKNTGQTAFQPKDAEITPGRGE